MAFPSLVLGSFNLTDWSGSAYQTSVIAEGTSKGAPVPIEVAVKSWLQDGAVVVTQGYDNRTVTLRVKLRGPSLTATAQAEAALFAELGKPNLLTWTPASGPASVFVVVTSSMDETPSEAGDLSEAIAFPWRTYTVRLVCKAFPQSAAQVTATPTTPGATLTSLDTCSATTGWTGLVDGVSSSPSVVSGSVVVTGTAVWGVQTLSLTKTFAATTSSTNLLLVDWSPSVQGAKLTVIGDGVTLPLYAETASPTAGYVRSWFYVAAASLAVTKFETSSNLQSAGPDSAAPTRKLSIDSVAVTNIAPIVGTGRQQKRSINLVGSAPAQASVAVESATAALGNDTMVYVYEADETTRGYEPALGQFQSAGTTPTTDTALVSGHRVSLGGSGITYTIPLALLPAGMYLLLLRLGLVAAGTEAPVVYTVSTTLGSNTIASKVATSRYFGLTTTYTTFTAGELLLPTVSLDPKTPASLTLNLASSSDVRIDEGWLINTDRGTLIQVDCGTGSGAVGGAARRLFVEPPSVDVPRSRLSIGHSADRSDAFYPIGAVDGLQFPRFQPPQANMLVVTPNATDAQISLRYTPTWHTNPAQ